MDFCGNTQSVRLLETIVSQTLSRGEAPFPFLILAGESQLGKRTLAQHYAAQLTGIYAANDILFVEDLSSALGRKHVLKIQTPKTDPLIERADGSKYEDIGAREIKERCSMSSFSGFKVVILENIERLNTEAANSLLKLLEEPLPGRIIIATQSVGLPLDTLVSRGVLIRLQPVSENDIAARLGRMRPGISSQLRSDASKASLGRPGLALELLDTPDGTLLADLAKRPGSSLTARFKALQHIEDLDTFLDSLAVQHPSYVETIARSKKLLNTTVNRDALLFQLSFQL